VPFSTRGVITVLMMALFTFGRRTLGKVDYRCGFNFSTSATWWIRQACPRLLACTR